jgi:hypothetical protein
MRDNYLSIVIVTKPFLAANARGELVGGHTSGLQLITVGNKVYTVINGYSLAYALRQALEDQGATVWRRVDRDTVTGFDYNGSPVPLSYPGDRFEFHDTALRGFMDTQGEAGKKCSLMEISCAVSTEPYHGDEGFSIGHKNKIAAATTNAPVTAPDTANTADDTDRSAKNPFQYQRSYTRTTFVLTFDLRALSCDVARESIHMVTTALAELQVGGSQAANKSTLIAEWVAWNTHPTAGTAGLAFSVADTKGWPLDAPLTEAQIRAGLNRAKRGYRLSQNVDDLVDDLLTRGIAKEMV